jgi:hypothetical protein
LNGGVMQHPVRLVIRGGLDRGRLLVLFRLPAAIPHFIWLALWSVLCVPAALLNWLSVVILGRPAGGIARFLAAYVRYHAHLYAWFNLVGGPYPGFSGEEFEYPVDLQIDIAERQGRLGAAVRIVLAIPALLLAMALGGPANGFTARSGNASFSSSGVLVTVGVLGWFASLVRGRMPEGMRNLGAYSVLYSSQTLAYLFLLTDRYPDAAPFPAAQAVAVPGHPVALRNEADARRSRLLVFFRLPLAVPHLVWLALWSVVALLAAVAAWVAALVRGQVPARLHSFLERTLRYQLHVSAFLCLTANAFPGFAGVAGSYPVDLLPIERSPQARWTVAVRGLLAIPALLLASSVGSVLGVLSVLTWFYALVLGRAPSSLQVASSYALRYAAQAYAYLLLVTGSYPYSGPWAGDWPPTEDAGPPEPAPGSAASVEPATA